MASVSLTFLGGTDTVGGVHIVARSERAALVFDLGVVGNPAIVRDTVLFHEHLGARQDQVLRDYLRAGMAPLLEGLYDPARLSGTVAQLLTPFRRSEHPLASREIIDLQSLEVAVFLSHLHDDHAGLAHLVHPSNPLLMSPVSAQVHTGLVAGGTMPRCPAPVHTVAPGEEYSLGDLVVQVVEVDHDVPGSAGIVVDTPVGRFAYTGDWRGHGSHPDKMARFVELSREVDVLITEASTVDHPAEMSTHQLREDDVASWFDDVVASTSGTVYVSVHTHNVERQESLRHVAVANGRRLVLSPGTALLWDSLSTAGSGLVHLDGVSVWSARDAGMPGPDALPEVTAAEIEADPDSWVVELPTSLRPLLLDTAAGPGDTFVHVNGHPYGGADPGWAVLTTWVRTLGLRLAVASSHGHASPTHLRELVERVRPRVTVPVHTNAPHAFPRVPGQVRPVRRGESLLLQAPTTEKEGTFI